MSPITTRKPLHVQQEVPGEAEFLPEWPPWPLWPPTATTAATTTTTTAAQPGPW